MKGFPNRFFGISETPFSYELSLSSDACSLGSSYSPSEDHSSIVLPSASSYKKKKNVIISKSK